MMTRRTATTTTRSETRRLLRELSQQYHVTCDLYALTPGDVEILLLLFQVDGVDFQSLYKQLGFSAGYVSARLSEMQRRGWIEKKPYRYARGISIWLTEQSRFLKSDILETVAESEAWAAEHLPGAFSKLKGA